jgi:hypothetical protein
MAIRLSQWQVTCACLRLRCASIYLIHLRVTADGGDVTVTEPYET